MVDRPRILVVDDEPQITRVLRTSLSAQGYDIRIANSGEMALEIMKDWSPNLIITDLSMPSVDGIQLCRTVRAVSQVPIVVLSVRDKEQQKVEALAATKCGLLPKSSNCLSSWPAVPARSSTTALC